MKEIGNSSLWVEKYRPQYIDDLILPSDIKSFFLNIIKSSEIPNLLLSSAAGHGKCLDFEEEIEIFISEENYIKYFK